MYLQKRPRGEVDAGTIKYKVSHINLFATPSSDGNKRNDISL